MSRTLRSLYICYFPITEPLVQTQVVAYLSGLSQHGHHIHLLTFETERLTPSQKRRWSKRLKEQGIVWHNLRYHRRPSLPATVYDVLCGVAMGFKIIRRHRLDAIHARSHIPAMIGLILMHLTRCRLIFDIRGLMAEEYEDTGIWQRDSLPFRLTKAVERHAINQANGIVVLTERVKRHLFNEDFATPVQVIPCCADLAHIEGQANQRTARRAELGLDGKVVMVYAGKFGGWYLQREMVDFFVEARTVIAGLHFLVLTQSDDRLINDEFSRHGIPLTDYTVTRAEPAHVGAYLSACDFAISLIKVCPSKISSSPTKIGEYLAAGLPVVCNMGIGDVDAIITENHVGELIREFSAEAYRQSVERMQSFLSDKETLRHCQQVAQDKFSLEEIGIPRYHTLYSAVAQKVRRTHE